MRKVNTFKVDWDVQERQAVRIQTGSGLFHGFGMDYEEFESGPAPYSVAIIERDSGLVETVRADLIQFCDPSGA